MSSILRALAIQTLLSLLLVGCLLCYDQYEPVKTTTTTTAHPIVRTQGLSLPLRNSHPPKCMREVPAIFSQYEKHIPIIGNSTLNPFFNLIEVCCKGYRRYEYDWSQCVPDCGDKCLQHGFCLGGGVCQCFSEFVPNQRSICVPTCPLGCPHGQCYLNGTCVCEHGYELDATQKYCTPLCDPMCSHNEECAEPNRCACAEGYARSSAPEAAVMGCQPICIPDCGYGHCVGPNRCECFHGYEKRTNGTVCESNCYMRCENGFCVNRTMCACQNGYRFDYNTTSCLPHCGDNCENGICVSPGVCRCFNGYVRDGAKCVAVCDHGCGFYGKCIAPNVCGCAIVDHGPLKSFQRCEHGFCNSRGRCRCRVGLTRFIDRCLSPDTVTTYASLRLRNMNATFMEEFNLLLGQHFIFDEKPDDFWVRY